MIAQLAAAPEAAPAARPHRGRGKPQPVSGRGDASPARPLSLRAVTAKQLSGLPGIGPATAEKIIEMRDRHGGLASLRELEQLSGIGPATMETLRAQLRP
jgi:competence protein ComEA